MRDAVKIWTSHVNCTNVSVQAQQGNWTHTTYTPYKNWIFAVYKLVKCVKIQTEAVAEQLALYVNTNLLTGVSVGMHVISCKVLCSSVKIQRGPIPELEHPVHRHVLVVPVWNPIDSKFVVNEQKCSSVKIQGGSVHKRVIVVQFWNSIDSKFAVHEQRNF